MSRKLKTKADGQLKSISFYPLKELDSLLGYPNKENQVQRTVKATFFSKEINYILKRANKFEFLANPTIKITIYNGLEIDKKLLALQS